ncbi:MAG: hypothetical protein AB7P35_17670 [Hyphomonadaceae bacterium]
MLKPVRVNLYDQRTRAQSTDTPYVRALDQSPALAQGLAEASVDLKRLSEERAVAEASELDNELSQRIRERLYNNETGYLTTARGRLAQEYRPRIQQALQDDLEELSQRAGDGPTGRTFRDVASRRLQQALQQIDVHNADEFRTYQNEQSEGRIGEAIDNAVAAYGDEAQVQTQMMTALGELERMRDRQGWSDEIYANRVRQLQTDITSRVIVQLATTDPEAARDMYARVLPNLTAQGAAELRTTMAAAQRDYIESVEGMGWQALANGQPLNSIDPQAYSELTSNPLLGQSHMRLRQAQLSLMQADAEGRASGSSAYVDAFLASQRGDPAFVEGDNLERYVEANLDRLSRSDIEALFRRRDALRNNADARDSASRLNTAYNAVRAIARASLGAHGLTLSEREQDDVGVTRAFNAALQIEVQRFLEANEGRQPHGEEVQMVIGRAVVGMRDPNLRQLPQFRADRRPQYARYDDQPSALVPFAAIPEARRNAMIRYLRTVRGGDVNDSTGVTNAMVEALYAADLRGATASELRALAADMLQRRNAR